MSKLISNKSILDLLKDSYLNTRLEISSPHELFILDEMFFQIKQDFYKEQLCEHPTRIITSRVLLEELVDTKKGRLIDQNIGFIDYSLYQTQPTETTAKGKENFISILIPVKNCADRIYNNLTSLIRDLEKMPENTGFEFLICLNNCKDNSTLEVIRLLKDFPYISAKVIEFNSHFYIKSKKIPINVIFQFLQKQHKSIKKINPSLKQYIHFHDDDIIYKEPNGISGVFKNIQELNRYKNLKLTSGIYATFKAGKGFDFINSVTKDIRILHKVKLPPVQIYGGAATMPLNAFPEAGIPTSVKGFDAFMSTYLLMDQLKSNGDINIFDLPSRSNPNLFVEHPEEKSINKYIKRLIRDYEFKASIYQYFPKEKIDKFYKLRKRQFNAIRKIILNLDGADSLKVGFLFYNNFRMAVKRKYKKGILNQTVLQKFQRKII